MVSYLITDLKLQKQRAYQLPDGRWQNKYVITLPEPLINELGWESGSELEATKRDKSILVDFVSNPSKIGKRIAATKMTYDEFRDKIKAALQYSDKGITWTQLRGHLKLDQVVPNNKWVRRMEKDIGLLRVKGKDGVVVWRITHVR
jgi:antitoxin component of MazEF toxin-antitoxin module